MCVSNLGGLRGGARQKNSAQNKAFALRKGVSFIDNFGGEVKPAGWS